MVFNVSLRTHDLLDRERNEGSEPVSLVPKALRLHACISACLVVWGIFGEHVGTLDLAHLSQVLRHINPGFS